MSFDSKKFFNSAPPAFALVLKELRSFGFVPTVIGGVVRDFYLFGIVSRDWDIELAHGTLVFNRDYWKDLGRALSQIGRVTYLPFEIIRLEVRDFHFEFSPPRKEIFLADWELYGHKNFTAEFDYKLAPERAAARRDFTINAIGLRYQDEKFELIDPLNGIQHLKEKQLVACGADFEKDPVRFLRAYRFALKFGFKLSPELQATLATMPVNFNSHYLWEEMLKSKNPLKMYRSLLDSRTDLSLPIQDISEEKWRELEKVLPNPEKQEGWVLALAWTGFDAVKWTTYFNVGSESLKRLIRWSEASLVFKNILPEKFQGDFEIILKDAEFDLLFNWYFTTGQLLGKDSTLPLLKLIEEYLPAWIHLYRFEAVKDVRHIDPPLRARYQVWNLCQRL